nr:unnamed protein product [Callosobruchus analis]
MSQRVRPQRVRANINLHTIQRYVNRETRVKKEILLRKRSSVKMTRPQKTTQKKKLKHKLSASKGFTDCVNNVACPLCREHYSTSEWIRCDSCAT